MEFRIRGIYHYQTNTEQRHKLLVVDEDLDVQHRGQTDIREQFIFVT